MATESDKLFCRMAMKMELLTREQSVGALAELDAKEKLGVKVKITQLFKDRGELSKSEINQVIDALRSRAKKKKTSASRSATGSASGSATGSGSGSRRASGSSTGSGSGSGERRVRRRPSSSEGLPTALPTAAPADDATKTAVKGQDDIVVPPPPPRGQIGPGTVMGKYTLIKKLGEGAMGVVYMGIQQGMSRKVAIKVLTSALVANQRAVQRFQREAEAAARLSHPGIVGIFGMGEYESAFFIAMEFVDGVNIEDMLENERTPYKRLAEICALAAEGMEYAHKRGVIHRDIKPANIMLTHDGERVLIADFGLARPEGASQITGAGQLLGTPAYMAPEQASGDHSTIDHRTDVYSLGATFYEMLTLERPFPGKAVFEVLQKVLEDDPEDPCDVNGKVPRELADIALKAMSKTQDYRYQSAGEMAEDLRAFLRGDTPEATREKASGGGGKKQRRGKGGDDDDIVPKGGFFARLTGRRRKR